MPRSKGQPRGGGVVPGTDRLGARCAQDRLPRRRHPGVHATALAEARYGGAPAAIRAETLSLPRSGAACRSHRPCLWIQAIPLADDLRGGKRSSRQRDGSPSRTRTCDPRINSPLLYRLSYRGSERMGILRSPPGPDNPGQELADDFGDRVRHVVDVAGVERRNANAAGIHRIDGKFVP